MNPEQDVLLCLSHQLRRTARRVSQFYDETLQPSGLNIHQFTLLYAIRQVGHTPLQPLADIMGMDRTTLTRNLALLRRQGLIDLAPGQVDRRQQIVSLTPAALDALRTAMPLWRRAQKRAIALAGGTPPATTLLAHLHTLAKLPESSRE